jgi:hypothetical protein
MPKNRISLKTTISKGKHVNMLAIGHSNEANKEPSRVLMAASAHVPMRQVDGHSPPKTLSTKQQPDKSAIVRDCL